MEIVITVDEMEPFVKATCDLKGDGPLTFKVYEEIALLSAGILNQHYPNTKAVAKSLTTTHLSNNSNYLIMPNLVLHFLTSIFRISLKVT